MILFFDKASKIDKRDTLICNLRSEGTTVKEIRNVTKIPDNLKNGCLDNEIVDKLIFHYSGRESVNVKKAGNIVKELQELIGSAIFIAVSSGDTQQSNARELGIKIVTTYTELVSKIEEIKDTIIVSWTEAFDVYCAEETKIGANREFLRYPLHSFLPLDIDIQALKILWNDNKKKDAMKYLKEMLTDIEDGFFLHKFDKLKKLRPEVDNKNELKDFLSIDEEENPYIYKFLELLEGKKKKCAGLTENDVQEVISYFSNTDYMTFHDWYWKLTCKGSQ